MLSSKLLVALMMFLGVGLAATQVLLNRLLAHYHGLTGDWWERVPAILASGYFWATSLGFLINVGLWLWILPKAKLPVVYPMLSFSYVAMLFLAYFIDHKPISLNNLAGVAFVILGIVLLAWEQ